MDVAIIPSTLFFVLLQLLRLGLSIHVPEHESSRERLDLQLCLGCEPIGGIIYDKSIWQFAVLEEAAGLRCQTLHSAPDLRALLRSLRASLPAFFAWLILLVLLFSSKRYLATACSVTSSNKNVPR